MLRGEAKRHERLCENPNLYVIPRSPGLIGTTTRRPKALGLPSEAFAQAGRRARNLALPGKDSERGSSLRPRPCGPGLHSLESHVIPAKAGIRLVGTWTPACAGVTKRKTFISMGGPQADAHSE